MANRLILTIFGYFWPFSDQCCMGKRMGMLHTKHAEPNLEIEIILNKSRISNHKKLNKNKQKNNQSIAN